MSLLQEEAAKLLGRGCEQMCTIERLRAEANGDSWQCTVVESQCEQQHEHFEKACIGLATQGASMDHDHHVPVMSSMLPSTHIESTCPI